MIIKSLWEGHLAEIRWHKKHKTYLLVSNDVDAYIAVICLVILTPIIGIVDLILLPFEIGFYFFKKWINQD